MKARAGHTLDNVLHAKKGECLGITIGVDVLQRHASLEVAEIQTF